MFAGRLIIIIVYWYRIKSLMRKSRNITIATVRLMSLLDLCQFYEYEQRNGHQVAVVTESIYDGAMNDDEGGECVPLRSSRVLRVWFSFSRLDDK